MRWWVRHHPIDHCLNRLWSRRYMQADSNNSFIFVMRATATLYMYATELRLFQLHGHLLELSILCHLHHLEAEPYYPIHNLVCLHISCRLMLQVFVNPYMLNDIRLIISHDRDEWRMPDSNRAPTPWKGVVVTTRLIRLNYVQLLVLNMSGI